ncbi:hypothetical protein HK405_006089, partial [Cladochytrium tenue]
MEVDDDTHTPTLASTPLSQLPQCPPPPPQPPPQSAPSRLSLPPPSSSRLTVSAPPLDHLPSPSSEEVPDLSSNPREVEGVHAHDERVSLRPTPLSAAVHERGDATAASSPVSTADGDGGDAMLPVVGGGATCESGPPAADDGTGADAEAAIELATMSVEDVPALVPRVTPRLYQLDIFERAKSENVIAVLDTGTGKTLIAVLLLKHVALEEGYPSLKRISVFLAPAVPLVVQQANYVKYNTNLRVRAYYGELGVDSWSKEKWTTELASADLLVMTPAILEGILRRNYISISDISLLVFDEAHHARKNSLYNQIVALYYIPCPEHCRPKIFGMTATPVAHSGDSATSVKQLEANLCSTAITTAHMEDLRRHVNKPDEVISYFPATDISGAFSEVLQPYMHSSFRTIRRLVTATLSVAKDLGIWLSQRFLVQALHAMTKGPASMAIDTDMGGAAAMTAAGFVPDFIQLPDVAAADDDDLVEDIARASEEECIAELLRLLRDQFGLVPQDGSPPNSFWAPPSSDLLSEKVRRLLAILGEYRDNGGGGGEKNDFCGIVFVEKRATARLLGHVLGQAPELGFLRVAFLVGHGVGSNGPMSTTMTIARQKDVVRKFANGTFNLMIATQVAEEGLDIQPCKLVVRFDMFKTQSQYIQSRGRARHKSSKYVILMEQEDEGSLRRTQDIQAGEERLREVLMNRDDDEDDIDHDVDSSSHSYVVQPTGARATMFSAVGDVYKYCSHLPRDAYYQPHPTFISSPCLLPYPSTTAQWISSVKLPTVVWPSIQLVTGPPCHKRIQAERCAALNTVRVLHLKGELDDHLQSFGHRPKKKRAKRRADMDGIEDSESEGEDAAAASSTSTYPVNIPACFRDAWADERGWLACFRVGDPTGQERVLRLGLLFPMPLPEEAIATYRILFGTTLKNVECRQFRRPVSLAGSRLSDLRGFQRLFFGALLRSALPETDDYAVMVTPLLDGLDCFPGDEDSDEEMEDPGTLVNWELVGFGARSPWADLGVIAAGHKCEAGDVVDFAALFAEHGTDLVVGDRAYWNRKYRVLGVLTDRSPTVGEVDGFENAEQFYRLRLKVDESEPIAVNQPLLLASPVPHIWQSGLGQASPDRLKVYLIPQFCSPFPLGAELLVSSGTLMPLLLQEVWCRLQACELRSHLGLALHASPATFQAALASGAARKVVSYERLEFLGDAFLKMHLSLHLFAAHPDRHEGALSRLRSRLERNSNLKRCGVAVGMPAYALVDALSRKTWTPPSSGASSSSSSSSSPSSLLTSTGTAVKGSTHVLSDKTVADLVEAAIGACVADSGAVGGAAAVRRLLGDEFVDSLESYVAAHAAHAAAATVAHADVGGALATAAAAASSSGAVLPPPPPPASSLSPDASAPPPPPALVLPAVAAPQASRALRDLADRIERALKYRFRDPALAAEAVTHSSATGLLVQHA